MSGNVVEAEYLSELFHKPSPPDRFVRVPVDRSDPSATLPWIDSLGARRYAVN